ncbi:MAG: hypothetical protein IPN86_23940 [Saprospiraceae bacterium]|nr:hypothetical protein [Saprospiraceae bacterium]
MYKFKILIVSILLLNLISCSSQKLQISKMTDCELLSKEYVYKKWDFSSCNNFKIEDNTVIKILQPAYKLMHGDLVDHRMHPPTKNICYNINVTNIDKYKSWYEMSFGIENVTIERYGGSFLFNLDKYGNISNLHIWYYIKNQNSKSGLDLSKKYPKYKQKPRY